MAVTGVVVSTFGSPSFVALQLESLRRLAPFVPVAVHDDCSGDPRLGELTSLYGAELLVTPRRLGHMAGDVSAYRAGLAWAWMHELTNVVKISRRFVPLVPWLPEVEEALRVAPTAGNSDEAFGWVLRTEFVGLRVADWLTVGPEMRAFRGGLVEPFMAGLAGRLGPVVEVPFLGSSRAQNNGQFLWYSFASAEDYAGVAAGWGLDLPAAGFDVRANLEHA